jgi:oxalate decarboxylase
MRVPHWHANATEVGVVLNGKMRITIWDGTGNVKVFTVEKNGTWTIPAATLHSLENVGTGDLAFLVGYNMPNTADRDFVTAWAALPDAILEQSVGLTPQEIVAIKKTTKNRLSKYDPSAAPVTENIASPFSNNFSSVQPLYSSPLGSVKRIDANNTPAMQAMAIQQTILKPGSMREPHWYTGADDFFYVCKGTAFFTMMADDGKVYNVILKPGDLVFIPVGTFHTYVNVGKDDLEVYETFDGSKNINEITLLSGAQHFSAETLAGAIGISKESAQKVIARPSQAYITAF